ncbi:MAG: IS630 family transposase [Planctomycetia bacterium]|nr:IS630 family transposase [Planctomycetia bacterium]
MPFTGLRKDAETRRLKAMELLDAGYSQRRIADELGVTPSAVSRWARQRREGGDEALAAKPHPGRPKKLNERQIENLVKLLLEGPRKHGFATDLWTLPRIAELIERKFGVTFDPSGVWHVMQRLNWSPQKPERQAREQDVEAVEQWRTTTWSRIKKRPA